MKRIDGLPNGTDQLEILWDCHDCGAIFWQDEHSNEPDPFGRDGEERSTCPFCGSADGAGVMNHNEPVNRDALEDFARRERQYAWDQGCLAGFSAAAKGYYKKDTDEGMERRLAGIEKLNPYRTKE